jgi:hypothetical protein
LAGSGQLPIAIEPFATRFKRRASLSRQKQTLQMRLTPVLVLPTDSGSQGTPGRQQSMRIRGVDSVLGTYPVGSEWPSGEQANRSQYTI